MLQLFFVPHALMLLFLCILFLLIGISLIIGVYTDMNKANVVENLPKSKIRGLAMGLNKIIGTVRSGERTLVTPFSGKKCIYYNLRFQTSSGKIKTIKEVTNHVPFFIKDESGKIILDPNGAEFDMRNSVKKRVKPNIIGGKIKDLIEKYEIKYQSEMTMLENHISPNSKLLIIGSVKDNPKKEEATSKYGIEDTMIGKGGLWDMFIITDMSEKEFIKKLKAKANFNNSLLKLLGGFFFFFIGVFVLIFEIGLVNLLF